MTKSEKVSDNNPLTNTTEEKNETSVNILNEYLHETPFLKHPEAALTIAYKCRPTDLYLAFHPELSSPPPNHC